MRRDKLFIRDLFERYPKLLTPPDETTDGVVRLPERYSAHRQEIRKFRRQREPSGGFLLSLIHI